MASRQIDFKKDFTGKAGKCAKEIIQWMLDHHLWQDSSVYVNGRRFSDQDPNGRYNYDNILEDDVKWEAVYVEDDIDVHDYLEFAGDFVSVACEGPLYEIINYYNDFLPGYDGKMTDELDKICEKYGMYYELGNAWNFSLREI